MDVYHWHKYLQDLVIEIVGLETNIRVFRHFLALHHSILWVFEYLIKNGFIRMNRNAECKDFKMDREGEHCYWVGKGCM